LDVEAALLVGFIKRIVLTGVLFCVD